MLIRHIRANRKYAVVLGFIVAPLGTAILNYASLFIIGVLQLGPPGLRDYAAKSLAGNTPMALPVFMMLGAYLVAMVIGIPAIAILLYNELNAFWHYLLGGVIAGTISGWLLALMLLNSTRVGKIDAQVFSAELFLITVVFLSLFWVFVSPSMKRASRS